MRNIWLSGVVGAFAWLATPAAAQSVDTADAAAAAFGMRQTVLDVSLSPSGSQLAYISPGYPSGEVLFILDLTSDALARPIFPFDETNAEMTRCDWASDTHLVCEAYMISSVQGLLVGFNRTFSVAADGSSLTVLSADTDANATELNQDGGVVLALDIDGEENSVLMTRDFVNVRSTGSRVTGREGEGLAVELVNVTNGRRRRIETPEATARDYWSDENGRVRLYMRQERAPGGALRPEQTFFYRPLESNTWEVLSRIGGESDGRWFQPVAVETERNVAYGFGYQNGFSRLYSAALDGSGTFTELLARDGVDIDQVIRIGRQQRVVGAGYATDRRQIEYFDPELAQLTEQLHNALPGNPLINIVGASADERKLLLATSSDVDPGSIYLLDRDSRALDEVLEIREPLIDRTMSEMRAVSFPAADGTMIPAYLTLPTGSNGAGLPAVVMPHGGPSARDEWGFDWLVQFFAARGYAVLQPNYRGSSGYGSDWFGQNGFQAWPVAIGDVNDAGRWLVQQGIADPAWLAIAGWSYGGYAALQSQVVDPALYRAVVAIAPVTDLPRLREESRGYTSSRLVRDFVGEGPHVNAGSPARNVEQFRAPVILFHGTSDQNVGVGQSRLMRDRLIAAGKPVIYHEYENEDHQLDNSWVRGRMLLEIDAFLREMLGFDATPAG